MSPSLRMQCVTCGNLDSVAGANSRQYNTGLCVCGGYLVAVQRPKMRLVPAVQVEGTPVFVIEAMGRLHGLLAWQENSEEKGESGGNKLR